MQIPSGSGDGTASAQQLGKGAVKSATEHAKDAETVVAVSVLVEVKVKVEVTVFQRVKPTRASRSSTSRSTRSESSCDPSRGELE